MKISRRKRLIAISSFLLQIQEESTRSHRLAVTSLEGDVRALEQKCADSNNRANNLKNELEKLKSAKSSNQHKSTQTFPEQSPVPRHESHVVAEKERKTENEGNNSSDILDVAASRIKQLEMSDSEEDSLSGKQWMQHGPQVLYALYLFSKLRRLHRTSSNR